MIDLISTIIGLKLGYSESNNFLEKLGFFMIIFKTLNSLLILWITKKIIKKSNDFILTISIFCLLFLIAYYTAIITNNFIIIF